MTINTTNYSRVAEHLAKNTWLIDDATSYNSLAKTLNSILGLKMQGATVSTIVAAMHGVQSAKFLAPLQSIRFTLLDSCNNESYLTVSAHRTSHHNSHYALALSNLQYKGDFAFDVQELFREEQYAEIERVINRKCIGGKIVKVQEIR